MTGDPAEDQMHNDVHVHVKDLEMSGKEDKSERDNPSQKTNEPEKNRSNQKSFVKKSVEVLKSLAVQRIPITLLWKIC